MQANSGFGSFQPEELGKVKSLIRIEPGAKIGEIELVETLSEREESLDYQLRDGEFGEIITGRSGSDVLLVTYTSPEDIVRLHEMRKVNGKWKAVEDGDFARAFMQQSMRDLCQNAQQPDAGPVCDTCSELVLGDQQPVELERLSVSSKTCWLCGPLFQRCREANVPEGENASVALDLGHVGGPHLRLTVGEESRDIPVEFPILPHGVTIYHLFRMWLNDCNRTHGCMPREWTTLPTRVLDVSGGDVIRLCALPDGALDFYTALSHRWRTDSADNFCTYRCNLASREAGIPLDDFPLRFRHAIGVTKQLGIRYLWIDSVCIVQPHNTDSGEACSEEGCDSEEDWDRERDKMEQYFGSAYCVLAATAATDSQQDEGFLDMPWVLDCAKLVTIANENRQKHENTASMSDVKGGENTAEEAPRFDHVKNDFNGDVEESLLNRRGWVLQERALARRTIHFGAHQAYWECGRRIRCQTLTRLKCDTTHFIGDSEFPGSFLGYKEDNRIQMLQWILEKYTQSDLTRDTDRPVAISGLQKRLERTLNSPWKYGICQAFFHRLILWRRAGGPQGAMPTIDYTGTSTGHVPSWSWMAYPGAITFPNLPYQWAEWSEDLQQQFATVDTNPGGRAALQVAARTLHIPELDEVKWRRICNDTQATEASAEAPTENTGEVAKYHVEEASLLFDDRHAAEMESAAKLRFVVVARSQKKYSVAENPDCYVLVMAPADTGGAEFRRAGVGSVRQNLLSVAFEPAMLV